MPDLGRVFEMRRSPEVEKTTGLASRFGVFVAERHPLALADALEALDAVSRGRVPSDEHGIDALRPALREELGRRLQARTASPAGPRRHHPRAQPPRRGLGQACAEVVEACDGSLRRAAIEASLTADERREILRGMVLTRATDNRLKSFFPATRSATAGGFQGKGFRSLGQEAIYAAGIRLRRGARYRGADGAWHGDVVAPLIRDLGVAFGCATGQIRCEWP